MKRKIFAAVLAVVMLLSVFAVSASAADYTPLQFSESKSNFGYFTESAMQEICELGIKQSKLGFGCASGNDVIIYYNPSGSYTYVCFYSGDIYLHSYSSSNMTFYQTLNKTAKISYLSYWYGFAGTSSTGNGLTVTYGNIIYSTVPYYAAYGDTDKITGLNPNVTIGDVEIDASFQKVLSFWDDVYERVVNYDAHITDAINQGQQIGIVIGKQQCEASHPEGTYQDGYNKGYEDAAAVYPSIQTMYYGLGKQACEETHAVLFEEARMEGKYEGFQECEATHDEMLDEILDGVTESAYSDGYMMGMFDQGVVNQKQLEEEWWKGHVNGYDKGYTVALESSGVVLDYVDGVFSAPLNFLYNAFDIEILGVNLFNVIMVIISIIIVGAVVLFFLKFR